MPDPRHRLGRDAEAAVGRWLVGEGWTVLAHRWRVPDGELDLVTLDPMGTLVGIEVRARRSARVGAPAETVGPRHVARLRRALLAYSSREVVGVRRTRLDLVTLSPEGSTNGSDAARWRATRMPAIDGW